MKTIWRGDISFGLVTIPVNLHSAVVHKTPQFKLLDKKHHLPIHYKRVCEKCKGDVEWDDVVKGLKVSKDNYIVFSQEELKALKPEKTETIDILEIVDAQQIDPIFFNKHFFVAPEKKKEKAYFLLKEILESSAKAAIGRFVMRDKEYMCSIESYKEGLLLTTLNYAYEIRDIDEIEELKEKPKLDKKEIGLARELIDKLYSEEFDISEYKDTFAHELKKILKKKEKGELISLEGKKHAPKEGKNLVEALRASL